MVADGQHGVNQNRRKRQDREEDECPLAAYPVGQVRRCQISGERPCNHHQQVSTGVGHGKASRGQIERQPCGDRMVSTLRPQRHKRCKQRRPEQGRRKDLKKMGGRFCLLHRDAVLKDVGFGDMAANPHHKQRRQKANPEHRAPRQPRRQHGEK